MRMRWLVLGLAVGLAGGAASADSGSTGLSGLDAELKGTGRVGAMSPGSDRHIQAADGAAPMSAPEARTAHPVSTTGASESSAAGVPTPPTADPTEEYRRTEARVAACRIEVARRRQVPPAKVSAGTVTVRFTVDPNGRVRNAEALSASDTDPDVSACAKRVLSEWVFARHEGKPITVERTYHLATP